MKAVKVYTKDYCPYCSAAKNLLKGKGIAFTEVDMQEMSDSDIEALAKLTNSYRTVPQIFIGDEFIGGFDQLRALDSSGKLDEKLKE